MVQYEELMKEKITSYALYRWRYILGYTIGGLLIIATMVFNLLYVPGGIRVAEQSTAVASGALAFSNFNPDTVINLPYHVLQRASFALFDVSILSIKLPSIVLGILAIIGCYFLLATWFRRNVAIITTVIAATLPATLFIAQDGTAAVYTICVSFWLLYAATCVSRAVRPQLFWIILFSLLLALNLYTPLGIWLNIAILSTMLFHPHIRYGARRFNINRLAVASAVGFVILAPLIYSLTMQPSIGLTLLGIPTSIPDLSANLHTLSTYYFATSPMASTPYLEPLFPMAAILLIIIGFYRFILVKYTARSYVTWFWGLIMVPMVILNPESFMIILPLAVLMIAMGIASLIREWYVLFPRNPYARIVGLVPLGIIVVGIAVTNTFHYIAGYHYSPSVAPTYSQDLRLLDTTLARTTATESQKVPVIIPKGELQFYELVSRYDNRFSASSSTIPPTNTIFIVHGDIRRAGMTPAAQPEFIAVDARQEGADRFYLYTGKAE